MEMLEATTPTVKRVSANRQRYTRVENLWPTQVPPLTDKEAITAFKRLWRKATGKPWRGMVRIRSDIKYNWYRDGHFDLNPARGWNNLVHDVSHYAWLKIKPNEKSHGTGHASFEYSLRQYVLDKGWLEGNLKRAEPVRIAKPVADVLTLQEHRAEPDGRKLIERRLKVWLRKHREAKRRLKATGAMCRKLERQLARQTQ